MSTFDLYGSGEGQLADSCEHGDGPSRFIKDVEFVEKLQGLYAPQEELCSKK
jgi:hypothetical protein